MLAKLQSLCYNIATLSEGGKNMKNIKQITKKLFLALISAVIVLTSQNVNAVASSIELGVGEVLPGYVSGVKFNTKVKKDGTLLYCLNMNKKTA